MIPKRQASVPVGRRDGSPVSVTLEAPVSQMPELEERTLERAWKRLGNLYDSSRFSGELMRIFCGQPSELPEGAHPRLAEVVLKGSDGRYYGFHQVTESTFDRIQISTYTTSEQVVSEEVASSDVYVKEDNVAGTYTDGSRRRNLTKEEALSRLWEVLDALPESVSPEVKEDPLTEMIMPIIRTGATIFILCPVHNYPAEVYIDLNGKCAAVADGSCVEDALTRAKMIFDSKRDGKSIALPTPHKKPDRFTAYDEWIAGQKGNIHIKLDSEDGSKMIVELNRYAQGAERVGSGKTFHEAYANARVVTPRT